MATDTMANAIEEVGSVAEELKTLRDKIKQYGEASNRLNDIGNVLDELNSSVGRIKEAFSNVLAHVENEKKSVEQLVDSVPEVVRRIEASDATTAMNELKAVLTSHEKLLDEVIKRFNEERDSQAAILRDLTEKIERNLSAQAGLSADVHEVKKSVSQGFRLTQESIDRLEKSMNQLQQGMADSSAKTLSFMQTQTSWAKKIQNTLDSYQNTLDSYQKTILNELKNKKGWFL
jgi:phage-related protein